MKTTQNKQTKPVADNALEAYEYKQIEIRKLIKQLESSLEKHDRATSTKPGGKNWAHVGDLTHVVELLTEARDFMA